MLTLWRDKLRASERPERIFDAVRAVIDATGVLAGRARWALDSTVLDDAVAKQALITALVDDALALIAGLEGVALDDEQADAVGSDPLGPTQQSSSAASQSDYLSGAAGEFAQFVIERGVRKPRD